MRDVLLTSVRSFIYLFGTLRPHESLSQPRGRPILEWGEEFKSIITRKKILAWIVKLTIPMFRDIDVNVIAEGIRSDGERHVKVENTFIPTRGGSTAILDFVFEMDIEVDGSVVPIVVGIEHQNDPDPGYPLVVRMQYYAAKMFGRQKHRNLSSTVRHGFRVYPSDCVPVRQTAGFSARTNPGRGSPADPWGFWARARARMFLAAFTSLSMVSPHTGQTCTLTERSFLT